ncbi:MAG: hypothetical protein R6U04_04985 [Bacteroidales bacterium]
MRLKRPLKRQEIILIIMLIIAIFGVAVRWDEIKEGTIKGWRYFDVVEWFKK